MMSYVPKPIHAAVAAFVCILLIALGAKAQGRVLLALNLGAMIFAIITAVILFLVVLEAMNERVRVMAHWMQEFAKLDDEGRAAVAFTFPTMRYRMKRGEVRELFEDTNVPIDYFRLFLQTSNNKSISPERDWSTTDRPRWMWIEIKTWLEERDYILPDSSAGSHSWLWNGEAYKHLFAYWMAGHRMKDWSAAYASETE